MYLVEFSVDEVCHEKHPDLKVGDYWSLVNSEWPISEFGYWYPIIKRITYFDDKQYFEDVDDFPEFIVP